MNGFEFEGSITKAFQMRTFASKSTINWTFSFSIFSLQQSWWKKEKRIHLCTLVKWWNYMHLKMNAVGLSFCTKRQNLVKHLPRNIKISITSVQSKTYPMAHIYIDYSKKCVRNYNERKMKRLFWYKWEYSFTFLSAITSYSKYIKHLHVLYKPSITLIYITHHFKES